MSVHPRGLHAGLPDADFARLDATRFAGHARDPSDPARRLVVEILLDGEPVALHRAERFDPRLLAAGLGDGCYGFLHVLDPAGLDHHRTIAVRLANSHLPVGPAIDLAESREPPLSHKPGAGASRTGSVGWSSGLRLSGQVRRPADGRRARIVVRDAGIVVAEARPPLWAPLGSAGAREPGGDLCPFSLHLPAAYADGQVHRLAVEDGEGVPLAGSPVAILALPDGLAALLPPEAAISDGLRAGWFDRLCPSSAPFSDLAAWRRGEADSPVAATGAVRIVLVGPDGEAAAARLASGERGDWSAVAVACRTGTMQPDKFAEAVLSDRGEEDLAAFLQADTALEPGAIAALASALRAAPEAAIAYGDLLVEGPDGPEPVFLGAYDHERQLEQGVAAHLFVARMPLVEAALAARPDSLPALFLALVARCGGDRVLHRPGLLARIAATPQATRTLAAATGADLAAAGIAVEILPAKGRLFPAIRVRREPIAGSVSLVIPTRDRPDLLGACLGAIRAHPPGIAHEIVVVDNGSVLPATRAVLHDVARQGGRVVDGAGAFNFARLCNLGVAAARGELVCLLNDDVEALEPGWGAELASRLAAPDVGAAGAVLRWPNGMVQHAGIVLGPGFSATESGPHLAATDAGHGDMLRVAREASAATAACLMLRRADYLAVGGMDEVAFPVLFNDVDLCLKLRARGQRVVVTPHLALLHRESASRGRDQTPERRARYRRELNELRRRWGEALAADSCYSPLLNHDADPFSALAIPRRPAEPRTRLLPGGDPQPSR